MTHCVEKPDGFADKLRRLKVEIDPATNSVTRKYDEAGNFGIDVRKSNVSADLVRERFEEVLGDGFRFIGNCRTNFCDFSFTYKRMTCTVEVKEDEKAFLTGNNALEFECNGKDSGIFVSKSHFYVYVVHQKITNADGTVEDDVDMLLFSAKHLKNAINICDVREYFYDIARPGHRKEARKNIPGYKRIHKTTRDGNGRYANFFLFDQSKFRTLALLSMKDERAIKTFFDSEAWKYTNDKTNWQ